MTAGPAAVITCDATDRFGATCAAVFVAPGATVDGARSEAADNEWDRVGDNDYCPAHAAPLPDTIPVHYLINGIPAHLRRG